MKTQASQRVIEALEHTGMWNSVKKKKNAGFGQTHIHPLQVQEKMTQTDWVLFWFFLVFWSIILCVECEITDVFSSVWLSEKQLLSWELRSGMLSVSSPHLQRYLLDSLCEHSSAYTSFTDDTLVLKSQSHHTLMLVKFWNTVGCGCNEIQQNCTGFYWELFRQKSTKDEESG